MRASQRMSVLSAEQESSMFEWGTQTTALTDSLCPRRVWRQRSLREHEADQWSVVSGKLPLRLERLKSQQ